MNKNLLLSLLAVATLAAFCPVARAASFLNVTWDAAQDISGDSDVSTAGTLVAAYAFGDSGVPSSTVNGVTFSSFTIPASSTLVTHGDVTVAVAAGGINPGTSLGSTSAPFTNLSSGYQQLLSNSVENSVNNVVLTFSGLTAGKTYQAEFWVNVSNSLGQDFNTKIAARTTGVNLSANTTAADGGLGQFVTGTFTPAGTFGSVSLMGLGSSGFSLDALQLRDITAVPEPSTWALLPLAGGALLWLRRRA